MEALTTPMSAEATAVLRRYKVLSYAVGVALAVFCLLMIIFGLNATVPKNFSVIHGLCYMVYLYVVLFQLLKHFRCSAGQVVLLVASGIIPLLAFFVEPYIVKHLEVRSDATEPEEVR